MNEKQLFLASSHSTLTGNPKYRDISVNGEVQICVSFMYLSLSTLSLHKSIKHIHNVKKNTHGYHFTKWQLLIYILKHLQASVLQLMSVRERPASRELLLGQSVNVVLARKKF